LALLQEGRFAEAQAALQSAVEHDPFLGAAYNNLGIAQLKLEKPFEAAFSFQNAIRLTKAVTPRTNLGILLERAGNLEAAEENYRAALRDSPDDVEIVGYLARLHVRQNRLTPETRAWLHVVAAQENDSTWRQWAQRELARTSFEAPSLGVRP
jgi:tetratricopeptide (TPR) repeat protein